MPLHNAMFSRTLFLGVGFCAAAGDPSNSKMRIGATPLMMPRLAIDSISSFPNFEIRERAVAFATGRFTPGYGGLASRTASAQLAALAPSTDIQMSLLFGSLGRGCPKLTRDLTLSLFNKGGKFHRPIGRNFDVWRSASYAHSCGGSVDLYVARLCFLASDESKRSFAYI